MTIERIACVLVFIITYFHLSSSQETIRNFKNYTLFELRGPHNELMKIIDFLGSADDKATYELGPNISHVLVAPDLKARFKVALNRTNLHVLELSNDFEKLLAEEKILSLRYAEFSWNGYYNLHDIYSFLATTQSKFRSSTQLVIAGHSFEGREILGLKICTNVQGSGTTKPIVLIEAGMHGREWIAPAVTTYFINQLFYSKNKYIENLRNTFEWHIFPVLNPDGYRYTFFSDRMWRKTRSKTASSPCYGADLNRNWDCNFGTYGASLNPCDYQTYRGKHAFSEIEAKNMSSYILGLNNVMSYLSIHSYTWAILLPYSHDFEPIKDYTRVSQVAKYMTKDIHIKGLFDERLYYGVGISSRLEGKASGVSTDWAYMKGIPLSLIVELRGQNFTWPASKIIELGDEFTKMMINLRDGAKLYGFY